jgi:hypothetical protein
VKFLCGHGSPAVRLRSGPKSARPTSLLQQVVTRQPGFNEEISKPDSVSLLKKGHVANLNSKDLNLALTFALEEVASQVKKKGNKFTEGLDLSNFDDDWGLELRPSMKKLRQGSCSFFLIFIFILCFLFFFNV